MTRPADSRGRLAERTFDAGALVTLVAAVLTALFVSRQQEGAAALAGWPAALIAVAWTAAWLLAARFRFLTARRPRAWLVVLAIAWAGTLSGVEGLRILGLILGLLFMVRRQAGLSLLSSRRRVIVFLIAGPLLIATLTAGFGRPEGLAGSVLVFCRTGVQLFLIATVQTLLIGMRLHFLRLRPKLLVAGLLVGVVPLMLLTVFGLLLLYGTLGGSRANRARDMLQDCALTFDEGRQPALLTAPPVHWDERRPDQGPDWAPDLIAALRESRRISSAAPGTNGPITARIQAGSPAAGLGDGPASLADPAAGRQGAVRAGEGTIQLDFGDDAESVALATITATADTTAWIQVAGRHWLARWRDPGPGKATVDAILLDAGAIARLVRVIRADAQVRDFSGGSVVEVAGPDGAAEPLQGRYRSEPSAARGWLQRPRFFGTTMLETVGLNDRNLSRGHLWLTLETSFEDLSREFASREAVFNVALLISLGVVAVLLLLTSLTAFIFSLRITGGITGAVKALHRGTQRLAGGELDAVIDLENEDEFGDLADSFNAMTVAVKQGREDALARERLQQEMQTARQIQERLLPRQAPELIGWEITGVSLPNLQVGGDYFDFLQSGGDLLGLAIGDVSGKGMPAALLMSNLQASLKGQVINHISVGDVVTRINRLLATSTDPHMFATFIYGELDTSAGTFVCANAGHEPPLVVRRDGGVEWLSNGGLLLGMFTDQIYEPIAVALEPGDVLVLYTDGITEAGAPTPAGADGRDDYDDYDESDDPMFGEQRLADVVCEARARSAPGIREAILSAIQKHLAGRPPGDDITLVVVKRSEVVA